MCLVSFMCFSLFFSSVNWTHKSQTSVNQSPKCGQRHYKGLKPELPAAKWEIKAAKTVKSKIDYTRSVLLQIGWITDLEWLSHLSWFLFLCAQWWKSSRVEGPGITLKCLGLSWWGKLVKQGFKSSSGYMEHGIDSMGPLVRSEPLREGKSGGRKGGFTGKQIRYRASARPRTFTSSWGLGQLIIMTLRCLRPALPAESSTKTGLRHKPKHEKRQSSQ